MTCASRPRLRRGSSKQNEIARAYLDAIPQRPQIKRRLTEIWNYERFSAPQQQGGKYFYLRNDGLQNQAVLFVADTYDADGRVLIDPNEWSKDGTIALAHYVPSKDGKLLAYSKSEAGSDWQQIYVLNVATGEALPDEFEVGPIQRRQLDRRMAADSFTRAIPNPRRAKSSRPRPRTR